MCHGDNQGENFCTVARTGITGRNLKRMSRDFLAYFDRENASNGPTETIN